MRIGIDARLWNQTGVGRYIRNLVYNLESIDKDNDYVLFVRAEDTNDVRSAIHNSQFTIHKADIPWHSLEEQFLFPQILNQYNLDLVHFPYYSVPILYNKPFVVTIHDLIPLSFPTGRASALPFPFYWLKNAAFRFVVSNAAKKARKIIAPSKFSKQEIERLLEIPGSKVQVIYEGTDKALVQGVRMSSNKKKNDFLYIGNAYPHKNLDFLIEVFKELPEIKLILVGKEDAFYKRLKKKAKKLGNVEFFGYAKDSDLINLYAVSKALIVPSFIEGFGLPVLEAMSNRCLVLASDISVLHEVGKDAALYFNPRNKEELKKLIQKVNSDKEFVRTKIEEGLESAKKFSWKKTAQETVQIYKSCV